MSVCPRGVVAGSVLQGAPRRGQAGARGRCGNRAGLVLSLTACLLSAEAARAAPATSGLPPAYRPLPKGPWIQQPRQDGVSVLWETRLPIQGVLRYGPRDGAAPERQVLSSRVALLHRVDLAGLSQATVYRYAVADEAGAWHEGTFQTQGAVDQPFTFLVYGDCRSQHEQHRSVVEAMLTEQADFAVNTGDFVADGAQDRLWQEFFTIARPFVRHRAMYPVLGNHELTGSWTQGLAAFRRHFAVPRHGPEPGVVYHFEWGNSFFLVLNTNLRIERSRQLAWAEERIAEAARKSHLRHLFVFWHHSPYASGAHGANQDLLRSGLPRTLARHGVDLTFAGHDHVYERGEEGGLRYVVTGGCGAPLYPRRRINAYTAWFESTPHYTRVTVEGDQVELTARRPDGSMVDHLRFEKRRAGEARRPTPRFVVLKDAHPRPPRPTELGETASRGSHPSTPGWGSLIVAVLAVLLGLGALLWGNALRRG